MNLEKKEQTMIERLYSEIRDDIKTGDLLIWDTELIEDKFDLLLKLYQKIFNAKYTHVGIAVSLGGRKFLVEAIPPVVRLYPISRKRDFYWLKLGLKNNFKYLNTLFMHLGKPYSLFDLIKHVFRFKTDQSDFYCSELASLFYKEVGLLEENDIGVTPDKLVNLILNKSKSEIVKVKIDSVNIKVL